MLVSDDYPRSKLLREFTMYCGVGCINVAIFFVLYWFFSDYASMTKYPETFGWAVSFFISSVQAFVLHRWLTFESESEIRSSFTRMMIVYTVLWIFSTVTFYALVEVVELNEWISWAINTGAFGFFTFIALRFYAFPLSDGRVTRKERLDNFRERRKA